MVRNRPTPNPQPDAIARAIIDAQQYMTIATADVDGTPLASPVWYAHDGYSRFLSASKPGSRHSKNISARPQVGIAIFDSSVAIGQGQGVYISATATESRGVPALLERSRCSPTARLRTGRPPGPFVMSRDLQAAPLWRNCHRSVHPRRARRAHHCASLANAKSGDQQRRRPCVGRRRVGSPGRDSVRGGDSKSTFAPRTRSSSTSCGRTTPVRAPGRH